jgi:hypothetical protein
MSKRQARGVVKGILTKRLNPGKPEIGSRGKIKAAAPLHQPKIKAIIDEHFNQRKQANLELHRRALKHVDPDSNRSLGAKYTLLRIILRHESGKTPHTVDELYQEVSTSSHVKGGISG